MTRILAVLGDHGADWKTLLKSMNGMNLTLMSLLELVRKT